MTVGPINAETTAMNPQFFVQIPRTASAKCHVVVSVTQHYETRGEEPKRKRAMHAIGFAVYEVPPNVTRLTTHFVAEHVRPHTLRHNCDTIQVEMFTLQYRNN